MEVTRKIKGEYVIFGIKGSLDMNNVKYIKKIFDDAVDNGAASVAIDMISLNYIDSSGIGSFIGLMTKLKSTGGNVVLLNMKSDIERIFSMTKLLAFFKVYRTEEEFYQSIDGGSIPGQGIEGGGIPGSDIEGGGIPGPDI